MWENNAAVEDCKGNLRRQGMRDEGRGFGTGEPATCDLQLKDYEPGTANGKLIIMIVGTGIDLVEIERIQKSIDRFGARFLDRLYTAAEQEYCLRKRRSAESFAARFAAKEAGAKALGTGISRGVTWREIEVVRRAERQALAEVSRPRRGDGGAAGCAQCGALADPLERYGDGERGAGRQGPGDRGNEGLRDRGNRD